MRDIAKLLFGEDTGKLLGLFGDGDGDFGKGDGDESGAARRVRRAGEWCGTTPRRAGEWCGTTPGRSTAEESVRGAARARGARRQGRGRAR